MYSVCNRCLFTPKGFGGAFISRATKVLNSSTVTNPKSNSKTQSNNASLEQMNTYDRTDDSQEIQNTKEALSKFVRYEKDFTNEPFVKNLFLGKFNKQMLVFPEFSNNEELNTLNKFVQVLEIVLKEKVDSSDLEVKGRITKDTMDTLRSLGLFGLQVPEEYGGLGITATKYSRLSEVTAVDSSVAITLSAHQAFALAGLIRYGTDEQKSHYLPLLSTGQQVAALCLSERNSGSDSGGLEATATPSEDGSIYYLNGTKTWVVNGTIADVLIVFAKTRVSNDQGEANDRVTGFIVERGYGGVTSLPCAQRLGVRAADICDVEFKRTPVPAANILGVKGQGFKVAMDILNNGRHSMGGRGSGLVKKLINDCIEHVISRKQFGQALQHYQLIKDKLAWLAVNAYAMESVTYLTTMTLDNYQKPDISLEAAIVKVFCSERLWSCMNEVMNIFGATAYTTERPYERHLRDSRVNLVYEGTNDILRLYIALTGLQHAGEELKSVIKKKRNPLDNPGVHFTHLFKHSMKRYQFPKLTHHLNEEVHPNLAIATHQLETNVLRFEYVIKEMLTRYANTIPDEQMVLRRLSDTAILLYTMTACIGRASRSICIGLPNHDDEILMTNIFCHDADRTVYTLMEELVNGPNVNMDANKLLIADKMLKQHKYTPTHPLERNW